MWEKVKQVPYNGKVVISRDTRDGNETQKQRPNPDSDFTDYI